MGGFRRDGANQKTPRTRAGARPARAVSRDPKPERALIQAAFDVIAERGFEGLRTRAVAQRAGVTVGMVHYYYRNKETLIRAVVRFIGERYQSLHAPAVFAGEGTPLERLRQEFADAQYYAEHHPRLGIVYQELFLRSKRDPTTRPMVQFLERHRYADIEGILRAGVRQAIFSRRLDVPLATNMIVSLLRGALLTTKAFDYGRSYDEVARWLREPRG